MDATSELKNNLINRLRESSDLNFLKSLQDIFDSNGLGLQKLSAEQKASIKLGLEDLKNGNVKEHNNLMSDLNRWLKE